MPEDRDIEDSRNNTRDPQKVVYGTFKKGANTDVITFKLEFYLMEMIFIVTIPEPEMVQSPVYIKFKLKPQRND